MEQDKAHQHAQPGVGESPEPGPETAPIYEIWGNYVRSWPRAIRAARAIQDYGQRTAFKQLDRPEVNELQQEGGTEDATS
jgi:hypothetical protein